MPPWLVAGVSAQFPELLASICLWEGNFFFFQILGNPVQDGENTAVPTNWWSVLCLHCQSKILSCRALFAKHQKDTGLPRIGFCFGFTLFDACVFVKLSQFCTFSKCWKCLFLFKCQIHHRPSPTSSESRSDSRVETLETSDLDSISEWAINIAHQDPHTRKNVYQNNNNNVSYKAVPSPASLTASHVQMQLEMSRDCFCRCFASSVTRRQQALFIECPWLLCMWEKNSGIKNSLQFQCAVWSSEWDALARIISLCGFKMNFKPNISFTLWKWLKGFFSIFMQCLWTALRIFLPPSAALVPWTTFNH